MNRAPADFRCGIDPAAKASCVNHESLSRQATCGTMIRERMGGNRSLRSELEGRQCQSVD
jgi:hypothetical protein